MAEVALIDWLSLKSLRGWTPLSQLGMPLTHLSSTLYKVAQGAYVICAPYNRQLEEVPGEAFVTMVVWAETDGAARRSQLMDVEADQQANVDPPAEMLLRPQCTSYGDIVRELKRESRDMREWADYRAASDGAFVQRTINVPPLSFYFRRVDEHDDERCYAIQYRLARAKAD